MAITLNATSVAQPTGLKEWEDDIKEDNSAISGNQQRDWQGLKKRVVMEWKYLTPTEFQALRTICQAGATVAYVNDASPMPTGTFSVSGLPDFEPGELERGGTKLMVGTKLTIVEAAAT